MEILKKIDLDTMLFDGMYMDIHSISFEYTEEFLRTLSKAKLILEENPFLSSVTMDLFNNNLGIDAVEYFNSTIDDEERTNEVDSRIDTEILIVYKHGVYYRGYSKWSSDFLEVDLGDIDMT